MFTSFYEVLWVFFLYSFFGWCVEVVYFAVNKGKFVNRGFLAGPVCPIYGLGIVAVLAALEPLAGNLPLLYLGSVVITSSIEFLLGWISEKMLHVRLWDYRSVPFNIGGYVCLKFSLVWGLACLGVVRLFEPAVMKLIRWVPHPLGLVLLALFAVSMLTDLIITLCASREIPRQVRALEELEKTMKSISDRLGENLAEPVLAAREKYPELAEKAEEYRHLLSAHNSTHRRLVRAFPHLQESSAAQWRKKWQEYYAARLDEAKAGLREAAAGLKEKLPGAEHGSTATSRTEKEKK